MISQALEQGETCVPIIDEQTISFIQQGFHQPHNDLTSLSQMFVLQITVIDIILPDINLSAVQVTGLVTKAEKFDSKSRSFIRYVLLEVKVAFVKEQLLIDTNSLSRRIEFFECFIEVIDHWPDLVETITSLVIWIIVSIVSKVKEL